MKCLTLTQPWASLIAISAKKIETRSWGTKYRGPLAIHAAKGWTPEVVHLFFKEPFRSVLLEAGYKLFSLLPRGAVVATCELVSVREINHARMGIGWAWDGPDGTHYKFEIDQQERCFGDYADGRSAWLLHNVKPLPEPVPAKGSLGLWEWQPA